MESTKSREVEDIRQSPEYAKYMKNIGWEVESGIFVRRLGPVSIAKIQRAKLPLNFEKILRDNHVVMCKYEPLFGKPTGFFQDSWPLLASKTLRVDLKPSEENIFNSFKKDCRYVLRKCLMSNVKCLVNEFEGFYEIWKKSAKRKDLWIPSKKDYTALVDSFGEKCFCVTINDEAGAVILMHKRTAFYYYAGSTVKSDLPYLVVWEAMKEAKKRKCRLWDFEGIYDTRWPNGGWRGFSHFKRSFGGQEIEFPGCFTRWRLPF